MAVLKRLDGTVICSDDSKTIKELVEQCVRNKVTLERGRNLRVPTLVSLYYRTPTGEHTAGGIGSVVFVDPDLILITQALWRWSYADGGEP